MSPNAGHQLLEMEGFGNVVVGTEIETPNAILDLASSRKHDHRDSALGSNASEEVEPIPIGQPDIEDGDIRVKCADSSHPGGGRRYRRDVEAFLAQPELDEFDDPGLVFDEQHPTGRPDSCRTPERVRLDSVNHHTIPRRRENIRNRPAVPCRVRQA